MLEDYEGTVLDDGHGENEDNEDNDFVEIEPMDIEISPTLNEEDLRLIHLEKILF